MKTIAINPGIESAAVLLILTDNDAYLSNLYNNRRVVAQLCFFYLPSDPGKSQDVSTAR
jgi:hypothetical protein